MDTAAIDDLLAGYFGANKGANAPASFTLHLFAGHPDAGGTQLTTGYTPPTITNDGTSWPAPSNGLLTGAAVGITFTATLSALATHWALYDGAAWSVAGSIPDGPLSGGAGVTETVTPKVTLLSAAS